MIYMWYLYIYDIYIYIWYIYYIVYIILYYIKYVCNIYNISYYILYRLYTLYIIQITSKYYILYITYNVIYIYILYIYHKPRNSHTYKINWLYFADDWGHHLGSQLVFSPFPWRSSMSSRSLRPGTVGKHKIGFCWMAIHIFFFAINHTEKYFSTTGPFVSIVSSFCLRYPRHQESVPKACPKKPQRLKSLGVPSEIAAILHLLTSKS